MDGSSNNNIMMWALSYFLLIQCSIIIIGISLLQEFQQEDGQMFVADALFISPSVMIPSQAQANNRQRFRSSAPHSSTFHTRQRIKYHPVGASSSSSLFIFPSEGSASLLLSSSTTYLSSSIIEDGDTTTALKSVAETLGYLIGAASILLYTPIAIRIIRTKSADGLTISTWWLKLTSFTCTDVYNIRNNIPFSAFSETLVITFEAALVLALVTYYQTRIDITTFVLMGMYLTITTWALNEASDEWISIAQILATLLNTSALLPQLKQNFDRQSSGDYSPITASLASVGCTVRLFTTMELANGDPLILMNYGVALLLNLSVLFQVVYFGTQREGKSLAMLFLADVKSSK